MSSMLLRIIEEMELVNMLRRNRDNLLDRGNIENDQQVVLDQITNLLKCDLSQSIVGIYLHGSMAMGALPLNKVILIY